MKTLLFILFMCIAYIANAQLTLIALKTELCYFDQNTQKFDLLCMDGTSMRHNIVFENNLNFLNIKSGSNVAIIYDLLQVKQENDIFVFYYQNRKNKAVYMFVLTPNESFDQIMTNEDGSLIRLRWPIDRYIQH